jgi:hypothetical protein
MSNFQKVLNAGFQLALQILSEKVYALLVHYHYFNYAKKAHFTRIQAPNIEHLVHMLQ